MRKRLPLLLPSFFLASLLSAAAGLYTEPDPSLKGGIEGRISGTDKAVQHVLAIAPSRPEKVYAATLSGLKNPSFRFSGLPMDRYDLVVICSDALYEGLRLQRGEDSLTSRDRTQIEDAIQKSEPYFTIKNIHRLEGETGRGNTARAICTFARDRNPKTRNFKLILLKQVGPGWQIMRSRELNRVKINDPSQVRVEHGFKPALSGIRVTDYIRDAGSLDF